MTSESRKELNEQRATETPQALTQDDAAIKELPPQEGDADAVRGGALPPNEKPGVYVLPPNDIK